MISVIINSSSITKCFYYLGAKLVCLLPHYIISISEAEIQFRFFLCFKGVLGYLVCIMFMYGYKKCVKKKLKMMFFFNFINNEKVRF